MHSPIMAVGNGVPAIVCRFEEQTSKGLMWRDIGLGDWLFDFDQDADLARLPAAVLALARDPASAPSRSRTDWSSSDSGADTVNGSPLRSNVSEWECRNIRFNPNGLSNASFSRSPYFSSPATGCPACAEWTRI